VIFTPLRAVDSLDEIFDALGTEIDIQSGKNKVYQYQTDLLTE
jgi:hypothetical protein